MEAKTELPAPIAATGVEVIDGKEYMRDAKGALMPLSRVDARDKLIDELVRKMMGHARDLSAQIARFRGHCFDDVGSLQALLAQEYGAPLGGPKGNLSLTSYDGSLKVRVEVADRLEFGPELQAAKALVDACLAEWAANSGDEIRAIVNMAFDVEKTGTVNRSALFMLLRVSIEDERWQEAMRAIRESIRIIGSKTYFRFYEADAEGAMQAIPIALAKA
ncbi:DUF3164 family protein [Aquabacter cavernae]|uniref:DUF3164 family protein n=1 Tax=Aquabacter cavernae TaxID=2496029 RepID=UPI000F8EF3B4|nr:DUF3164 family protein [Aquabacter cavernae]